MKKNKNKKFLGIAFTIGIGWIIAKLKEDKRVLEVYEEKINMIYKQESVLNIYEQWIAALQRKKTISSYLLENNYYKIAIYGLGRLGRQLYEEMVMSKIEVSYVIDQRYSLYNKLYQKTRCYHPESELPVVDLIIVTVPSEEKEIVSYLKKKGDIPVKTMNDLLFVL